MNTYFPGISTLNSYFSEARSHSDVVPFIGHQVRSLLLSEEVEEKNKRGTGRDVLNICGNGFNNYMMVCGTSLDTSYWTLLVHFGGCG